MRLAHIIKSSYTALWVNKSRSLLTVLGIVIGVSSIIMVMSLGSGVQNLIVGELGGLGAETLVIRPGKEPEGPTDFAEAFFTDTLREREFRAIMNKNNVPNLVDATPEVFVSANVSFDGEIYHKATIIGVSAEYVARNLGLELERGVLYDERDIESKNKVALIGQNVKEELFGIGDAEGREINIDNVKFRVVGVLQPKGRVVFFNVDDLVAIPYTTAQTYITGKKHYTQILAEAESAETVALVKRDLTATLRELHNLKSSEESDFNVQTQQGLVEQIGSILNSFLAFLVLVVAIALLVGGVGVMNVMLVSVTERTREVGLRKALGATTRSILRQFLIESVILTIIGGVIGILIGAGLAFLTSLAIRYFAGFELGFSFPYIGATLGVGVSALVGLIFGIYPARVASKLSPTEAMRYE